MAGRILVIRGGAIGDFVLTLPALRLVREAFPEAHIEILGYRHIVALAAGRYYANAARSIEYGALSSFFVPNGELPRELVDYFGRFHQIISYLYDPDGIFAGNLRRTGAKQVIEAHTKFAGTNHVTLQLARPLERLALYPDDATARLFPSEADRESARDFLGNISRAVIALHPGSGGEHKNWPLENWLELAQWLIDLPGQPALLIIGGEADLQRVEALRRAVLKERAMLAQDLPLPHLAAVIEKARLYVGHDSGISHIAAAVGARCVLLFGPTDPGIWAPLNRDVRILRAPEGDLRRLPTAAVAAAVEAQLAESEKGG